MLLLLKKQRQELKKIFDLKKSILSGKQEKERCDSSTNLIVISDEDLKNKEQKEIEAEEAFSQKLSGINLLNLEEKDASLKTDLGEFIPTKKIVEGEDISNFPPEWQRFLIENEGKEPVEKLNKMLEN